MFKFLNSLLGNVNQRWLFTLIAVVALMSLVSMYLIKEHFASTGAPSAGQIGGPNSLEASVQPQPVPETTNVQGPQGLEQEPTGLETCEKEWLADYGTADAEL